MSHTCLLSFRSRLAVLAFGCALTHSGAGLAQPGEAQVLFDRGVADMLAGRFDHACPAIERSYQLEPLPGVMFTLAECFAGAGKVATALARYADFRTLLTALPSDRRLTFEERERLATSRSAQLARRVPELTIVALRPAPDQRVTVNGEVLEPEQFGAARRVDPGTYVVAAEADGRRSWQRTITLAEGRHARISVPELTPPRPPATGATPTNAQAARDGTTPRKTWLYLSGGAFVTGVAVGSVSGIYAWTKKSTVSDHCPDEVCDQAGSDALASGRTAATVSNVAFGVAALGLAGAAVLLLLDDEPTSRSASARIRPQLAWTDGAGQLVVSGDFQ